MFKHGNLIPYYEFMKKEFGQRVIEELKELALTTVKFTIQDLKDKEEYYKQRTEEIKAELM
jgi:hypothetical protein